MAAIHKVPQVQDEPQRLMLQFNESINRRHLEGLAALMSTDHSFIDSAGHAIRGKQEALKAWKGFFGAFPDYQNLFDDLTSIGNTAVAVGRSKCSDPRLDGPALWTGRIEGDKVVEWRVWDDTPENRRLLRVE